MVDSFAVGKTQAVEPSFGSYVDTWQLPVNANFGTFDAAVSGTTTIDVTGVLPSNPYVNVTFSEFNATTNPTPWTQPNAGQNLRIRLIGALSSNISVLIQPIAGFWIFANNTSGSFQVTVQSSAGGGTTVVIPQGYNSIVFSDGTNVSWADNGNVIANVPNPIPSGSLMPFAMTAVPSGWLLCDGSAVLRSVYTKLFAAIGTTYGSGDGSLTFNVPNLQGYFLRGWNPGSSGPDAGRVFGSTEADGVGPLTVNDPGHFHTLNPNGGGNGMVGWTTPGGQGQGWASGNYGAPTAFVTQTELATTGITVTGTISETRPINVAVQYCIKT